MSESKPYYNRTNQILKQLVDHYKLPTYKLIQHLRNKYNASLEEIGQVMGVSKQAIEYQYLKKFPKGEKQA